MNRVAGVCLALLMSASGLFAGAQDTAVFHTRMLPDNEVPALSLPGTSADATITVRVVRDNAGAISAATVVFDINYTLSQTTTVVGLHIHNAPAGVNGSVVINTGLSASNSITGGSGHLTKVVNYTSTDKNQLAFVSGLLSNPELYYVNMHSVERPGGFIRGQFQASTAFFRPALSPANEVPPVTDVDAQAAALITVNVNRDASGTIVSGTVAFDVDYRFAGGASIVGMHIHSGAAGISGPVVISAGIVNTLSNPDGRGRLYRVAEIPSSDATGLKALTGIMSDPSGYYVNIHSTGHPAGVMRGQLQKDVLNFYSHLRGTEEVPANTSAASADVLTTVRVNRNDAGNITGGSATFVANYSFGGPVTLVGMHIHNAALGVNGPVEISSGLGGGANSVSSDSGSGVLTRDVTIDSSNALGVSALNGLFTAPRQYYVNIHTTVDPGGEVRAQMEHETYHLRPVMSSSNELSPVTPSASGTAWLTFAVNRDTSGAITSGTVTFDVDCNLGGPATIVAMHIHRGTAAVNGPVVIGSGISAITSASGVGNITSTASVASTDATALGALVGLIGNPGGYYLNLHTSAYPAGMMRSQLLPLVSFNPQVAGGGQWMSSITISNPSASSSVHGLIEVFDRDGNPTRPGIIDSTIPFLLPPAGSATFSTYNGGSLSDGYARIHSSAPVNSGVGYSFDGLPGVPATASTTATSVSMPVSFGNGGNQNLGIAILDLSSTPPVAILTLRDATGGLVPGGTTAVSFSAGRRIVGLLNQLLPPGLNLGDQFRGTLTIQLNYGPFEGGLMSIAALQFDSGGVTPVPIQVIQ